MHVCLVYFNKRLLSFVVFFCEGDYFTETQSALVFFFLKYRSALVHEYGTNVHEGFYSDSKTSVLKIKELIHRLLVSENQRRRTCIHERSL